MGKDKETEAVAEQPMAEAVMAESAKDTEAQSKKVAAALGMNSEDAGKIAEGELAVKLKYDIQGGLGDRKEGQVLRNLSFSAYNTLVQAGGHEALKAGTDVGHGENVIRF